MSKAKYRMNLNSFFRVECKFQNKNRRMIENKCPEGHGFPITSTPKKVRVYGEQHCGTDEIKGIE
jgi:hypothetical protein